jgi:uncharacterized protein
VNLTEFPALLQIAVFFLVWAALWLPIAIPLAIALKWHPPNPISPQQKLPLLASLYLLAPLVLWAAIRVEGTSLASYGLPLQPAVLLSLGLGFSLGVIGLAMLVALQLQAGWIAWNPEAIDFAAAIRPLVLTLLLALWISLTEELVFRGFVLNQLQSSYDPWVAAALSSIVFALLHLIWEGKENVPQLPGLWLMGMVLVLARWTDSGYLGLAWGLHTGWIWAIASLETMQQFIPTGKGAVWLVGEVGKPLTGVLSASLLLMTAVLLWQLSAFSILQ